MPQKTIQDLDAYIKATAVVYDHSNTKLVSRKTKVSRRRKEAFLSVLPYRKPSSHYHSHERKTSSSLITRKPRSKPATKSNAKDVKQKLQVFVRTPASHRPKTLYFELHPETSVSSLKEVIQKKIGVEARYQRLYIREIFQLSDLLTLEENGVDKNEIISLRLSIEDPKDEASIDVEYLKDLSSKIESSWKDLAKHLGFEDAEIADIQTTNESSTEESRHMLLIWWEKTTDRDKAAQKLRRALEAIGLTDLAQNVPVTSESRDEAAGPESERRQDAGVDKENKQNGAASAEEENVKNEVSKGDKAAIDDEYLKGLSPKIESSWKELANHLGYEEAEIADIQTTNEGSTEESRHMLLAWWKKTTDRDEAAQKLRRALEAIGLTDFAQNVPVTSESKDEAAEAKPERRQDAGVDEESKQNGAASTEEEKLKKEQVCEQDKPQLISRRYVQIFIQSLCSQKPKMMCLQVDPETPVLILKVIISEKMGVQPQHQRLFIRRRFRNFELCNLLTLNDCGIHQDENISLRLSTDGLLGGGPKDKHPLDDQLFRVLASKIVSSWEKLAKLLGCSDAEIKQFQTTSKENKERSLQMLLSWWRKQTNREEGFQSLRDALFSIGCAELALMIPEQQEPKQEEQRKKPQPEVKVGGASEPSKEKGTTSFEDQRPEHREDGHRDKCETTSQMEGAKKRRQHKETSSPEGLRQRQGDVIKQSKPQTLGQGIVVKDQDRQKRARPSNEEHSPSQVLQLKKQKLGQFEKIAQKGMTSSEEPEPRHGQLQCHQDKSRPEVQVGGSKEHSQQEETTSSKDLRPRQEEVAHRDKPDLVGEAKEQSEQKETTSSKDQRSRQEGFAHLGKPEPNIVERAKEQSQKGTTSSEGQRQSQQQSSQSQQKATGTDPSIQMLQSSEDQVLKWSTHQKQGGVAPRNPSEIQETVVGERTSQDRQIMQGPSSVQGIAPVGLQLETSSLSPAVPHCGPVKHVSVDSMHVGGTNNPTFLGPVYQPTLNFTQNVTMPESSPADTGRAQSSPSDAADKCRSELKDRYTTTGSYVQLIPWVDDDMKHIRDIYTELQLEKGDQDDIEGYVKEYGDIFLVKTKDGKVINRAILCGSAGMGKSTIIDKIAYDWATGVALRQFSLLFVLKMSALKQTSDLVESVFAQLLADDTAVDKDDLEAFIKDSGGRVLILIDGFDEFGTTNLKPEKFGPILRMLNRKYGKKCFVVVTTRPSHFAKLKSKSLIEKPFTHVKVLGFRMEDIGQYVRKFFPAKLDVAEGLLDMIQSSKVLSDLARSPMLLLLMCLLWREEGSLPDTLSRLFNEAIRYIFRRKMPELSEEAISEVVISIGKVALEGLISPEQRLSFQEGEFEKSVLDKAIQAGILTSQRVMKWRGTHNNVQFIHKTLQEYCAAMYCQSLLSKGGGEFQKILDKLGDPWEFENFLRFCCGDNQQCTWHVLRMLHEKNLHHEDMEELGLNCYFESQSRDLLSVDFIESFFTGSMEIKDYSNDSLNSLVWLLQHVAQHTEPSGVDYLAKVSEIHLHKCNLSRLSEVVALHWTKMKNLRVLDLVECSLTGSNVNILLSSFRNGGNLTGSARDWAIHLRGMKHLAKLSLHGCRLDPHDVVDIASSIGEMPNLAKLNLSGNEGLSGNAETWAASLQRMIHLESLDLSECGINKHDIPHIASSVGEMPYLAELNLSGNNRLGGNAETWASSLQSMIHLKKLDMKRCSINSRDFKYLAEPVSRMQNLVIWDFSSAVWLVQSLGNGIGVHIKMFTINVKDMADVLQSFNNRRDLVRLELQVLDLSDCSLQSADIEHLAAALGQVPNLAKLNLSGNKGLGGNAETWAGSLQRMTHLKSLDLSQCGIYEQDIPHIASSVGEMPNLADLNLSYNNRLSGHTRKWVACLRKVIRLQSFECSGCNTNKQDISHIAAMEMPNLADPDLTGNEEFGVNAKTWAASLKKMIHLNSLKLWECDINEQDLPHIASSVGEMPNLTDFHLSTNWDAGAFIGDFSRNMYHAMYHAMRHYGTDSHDRSAKECRVQPCDNGMQLSIQRLSALTGEAMADILQSFSNRKDLVRLTLCHIDGLGGSAKIWTPPLQNLTELRKLDLIKCSLLGTDIKHLAAAVSRMPALESLSLDGNKYISLTGSVQTWAHCLKQMKHVRSLKLGDCWLNEEDKKHIYEAWGSGVDFESDEEWKGKSSEDDDEWKTESSEDDYEWESEFSY